MYHFILLSLVMTPNPSGMLHLSATHGTLGTRLAFTMLSAYISL